MIDYSQSDFIAWQAERERLYAEIKRRTDDSDRMAQVAIDNARDVEALKTDLIYLIDRVMSQGSYSIFCKCEACERPRGIAARWEL